MPPPDPFSTQNSGVTGPITEVFAITADDEADLAALPRAIYVGTAGDVKITTPGGTEIVLNNLAAGIWHPLRPARIHATGTTAADIRGGY